MSGTTDRGGRRSARLVINAVVLAWARMIAGHRCREHFTVLLVDETSMRRCHRYVTVKLNGDTGYTLGMVPHRDWAALVGIVMSQRPSLRVGMLRVACKLQKR